MGDHRLPKRVISGELENARQRGPEGEKKEWMDCVEADLLVFGITGDGLEYHRTRPWGLVQHNMRRGLPVYDPLGEGRETGVHKTTEEEKGRRGG